MCDAMREKLAALLRSAVCAPAQPHNSDKLQNGAIEPVLVYSDDEGVVTLYFLTLFPQICELNSIKIFNKNFYWNKT